MNREPAAEPPAPQATAGRPRYVVWGPIAVLAIAVITVLAFAAIDALRQPTHRKLPPPSRGSVLLVPIGDVQADRIASLAADYHAEYGLAVELAAPIARPFESYDPNRDQYVAEELIRAMVVAHPELQTDGRVAIGITESDIYIRSMDWNWAFALRQEGRFAVISTAHMANVLTQDPWHLMRKMVTREIGFLCYQLPPSNDPTDVLYRSILDVDDLARIGDHL